MQKACLANGGLASPLPQLPSTSLSLWGGVSFVFSVRILSRRVSLARRNMRAEFVFAAAVELACRLNCSRGIGGCLRESMAR